MEDDYYTHAQAIEQIALTVSMVHGDVGLGINSNYEVVEWVARTRLDFPSKHPGSLHWKQVDELAELVLAEVTVNRNIQELFLIKGGITSVTSGIKEYSDEPSVEKHEAVSAPVKYEYWISFFLPHDQSENALHALETLLGEWSDRFDDKRATFLYKRHAIGLIGRSIKERLGAKLLGVAAAVGFGWLVRILVRMI